MSSTLTEANTIRRMRALEKLEIRIPRVNITSIIIRITQFLVLSLFSVGYAMSRPDVSLDIFVWPKEPPNSTFKVYVYRNTTNEWQSRAERLREPQELADVYHATDFEYNKTQFNPAEHGLSERYDCKDDPRWNCTGNEWAASRIGWVDSWPFKHPPPRWTKATVHIDRKIFYMMLLGGYIGLGHNLCVIIYAIEPIGIGFYLYCAGMDLFLALVFLFTGVFPISIQRHFAKHAELQIVDNKDLGIFEDYTAYLKYNQQYVFCMGWILWSLYTVTSALNIILVTNLERYRKLERHCESVEGSDADSVPLSAAVSSGFQANRPNPEATAARSYSRSTGHVIN